jgi:hypothetical protein
MKKTVIAVTLIIALLITAVAGTQLLNLGRANPYLHESKVTEVSPPAGTQAPIIIIHTPQNGSLYPMNPKNLTLTFDLIIPKTNGDKSITSVAKLYYKANWEPNEITVNERNIFDNTSFSIDLPNVWGGNLSITIYAVGLGYYTTRTELEGITMVSYDETFEMTSSSTVSFIKDVVPPRVFVLSPQNRTYVTSDVELDFTVDENVSLILYCLDGKGNQTMMGNMTLTGLARGAHSVTLYVADLAGNAVASETLFFSVNLPESFPVVAVAAGSAVAVAVVVAILLIYRRRWREARQA